MIVKVSIFSPERYVNKVNTLKKINVAKNVLLNLFSLWFKYTFFYSHHKKYIITYY